MPGFDDNRRLKPFEEAAEDAWLSRLAAGSMAEGCEPSLSLEEVAAELLADLGWANADMLGVSLRPCSAIESAPGRFPMSPCAPRH